MLRPHRNRYGTRWCQQRGNFCRVQAASWGNMARPERVQAAVGNHGQQLAAFFGTQKLSN